MKNGMLPGLPRPTRLLPREPFNGLTHMAGALLSVVGLFLLLDAVRGRFWPLVGVSLYGASLVTLYTASALYHSLRVSRRVYDALGRLDYIAIFLLIAGTYAPLCLISLRRAGGMQLLGAEYGLALAGSLGVLFWGRMPDWIRWVIYICMGWLLVFVFPQVRAALPPAAFAWLLGGGLVYMIGALILALDRPAPARARNWGHGLWHLFVLVGSACHFVLIFRFIVPSA